ncbi:hypothetical protein GC194_08145 [bacterium]|nr:hypothetical protein [bacterium]
MVSLDTRNSYIESLKKNEKLSALYHLFWMEPLNTQERNKESDTDEIYFNSIDAILNDDGSAFTKELERISKRKLSPDTNAPFVHNDFLAFVLILGCKKFQKKTDWLKSLILLKPRNIIAITLDNIIEGNYKSNSNSQCLILVTLNLLGCDVDSELLDKAYREATITNNMGVSDLINLSRYRAFDLVVELKSPKRDVHGIFLAEFERKFLKRTKYLSNALYNLFLAVLLLAAYYAMQQLPSEIKAKINDIGIIIGIGGVGLLGNLIPSVRSRFKVFIQMLLGYSKRKIPNITSSN